MKIRLRLFLLSFCLVILLLITSFSIYAQRIKYNQFPKYSTVEFNNSKKLLESNELFLKYKLIGGKDIYVTKVNNSFLHAINADICKNNYVETAT